MKMLLRSRGEKVETEFLLLPQRIDIKNLFFYLLILFLPTQFGRHFWPTFSLVSGIRVDYLSPTLYLTDILVLLLFVAWILNLLGRHSGNPAKPGHPESLPHPNPLPKGEGGVRGQANFKLKIGLLTAIILIGIVFSKNQLAGVYGFIKLLEFIFLGFYTAGNIKKLRFDIILLLFSIGIIFESLLAILQYFNQGSIGGIFYFFGERTFNGQTPGIANASISGALVLRPYGTFSHPNVLAGFLVIAMTMIVFSRSEIWLRQTNIKKIIFLIPIIVGSIALFLTMSRIAILLWLFIVMILGFIKIKKYLKSRLTTYYLLLTTLIIGSIFFLSPLRFRFTELRLSDESIMQREELVKDSFLMIKSNPIFGVGLNNFLVELPKVHVKNDNVFYLQPVHNIYLLILSQTGVVGLAFFIWFIGKTLKRIMNQELGIKRKEFVIHNSKFIILSSVLILGFFDHYFLTLQQGQLLFSFILGLCWAKK